MSRCVGLLFVALAFGCGTASHRHPPSPRRSATHDSIHGAETGRHTTRPGCGVPHTPTGGFVAAHMTVDGVARSYHVRVPGGYDPNRPYPVVFRFHGSGGTGTSGGLDIERAAPDAAIVVGPDGLGREWDSPNDLPFFDALFATVTREYCVDRARVFVYGFSSGASMVNQIACERGEIVRAAASIAGTPSPSATCDGNVAAILFHGARDDVVRPSFGALAREQRRLVNGCVAEFETEPSGCVRYRACDQPVVWCEMAGVGHDILGDRAPEAVWAFFSSLPERR